MYIEIICLFVNDYLNSEQFENAFFDNIFEYENLLIHDIYLKILSTNFNSKNEIVSLKNVLKNYLIINYNDKINNTNDAYVDRIAESERTDKIAHILRKRYEKKKIIYINFYNIINTEHLIYTIKKMLQFPESCGNNLDAINDFIYDVIFPEKLILNNWTTVEKNFPYEAENIKQIFNQVNDCKIIFG